MNRLIAICFLLLFLSCKKDKKQLKDNPVLSPETVTFVIKSLPENHNYNSDIYLSGNFEGWSGGRAQFKLKKEGSHYWITIPKYRASIDFKFTQGTWETVECQRDGNPKENRHYTFTGKDETVEVAILNWQDEQLEKPSTASNNVHVFAENFIIPQLNRERKIRVYLPPNYESSTESYPVLYMLDGQNVFDVSTSYAGEWEVDETLNKIHEKTGFGLIVVAIDHGGDKRLNEYSPWGHIKYGKGEGKAFTDFIINALKPKIDTAYRTKPNVSNTAIMGASMGGLIAHYAAFKYPNIFGKAGVLSPSYWYSEKAFDLTKINSDFENLKIFLLMGSAEGNDMVTNFNKMVNVLNNANFNIENLQNKLVPKGTHGEKLWRENFEDAITWLFDLVRE